jgi:hypothetical protein
MSVIVHFENPYDAERWCSTIPKSQLDDEHVAAISLRLFNVNHLGTLKPPGCCIRLAVAPAHCLCQRIDVLTRLLIYNLVELYVCLYPFILHRRHVGLDCDALTEAHKCDCPSPYL